MINLIAAVGLAGEIGLEGSIPWLADPRLAEITKRDLGWFAKQTEGGVLIVGGRTYDHMLTMGFKPGTRDVHRFEGSPPRVLLAELAFKHRRQDIWICGGSYTYSVFMPFVERFYISRIPWTGRADRFLPPILENWAYTGGRYVR